MVMMIMMMVVVMMIANNGPHTRAVARVGPSYRLTEATNIITPSHFSALLLRLLLLLLSQPSSIKHSMWHRVSLFCPSHLYIWSITNYRVDTGQTQYVSSSLFLQMTVFPRTTCTLVTTQLTLEEVDVEEEENIKDEEETLATTLLPTLQTRSLCLGRPGMLWQWPLYAKTLLWR